MNIDKFSKKYDALREKTLDEVKANLKGAKLRFNDITLRDGHQSLFATRMTTEQIDRVLHDIVECGFYDLEVWGGAILDVCMRYLNENPFERLKIICDAAKGKAYTRALLRGVNLFGYAPYPVDLIRDFCSSAMKMGLDIMRIFDALNDPENLIEPIKATKDAGGMVDLATSYTTGPIFDVPYWKDKFIMFEKLGADMVSVKDMAGLVAPDVAWDLIPELKKSLDVPIHWHSHCTPGFGHITAVIAMFFGIDCIDTCFLPFAGGSSHPSVELLHVFTQRLGIDDGLDTSRFSSIDSQLREIRKELKDFDMFKEIPEPFQVTPELERKADDIILALAFGDIDLATVLMQKLEHDLGFPPPDDAVREAQVPGGMLSNMVSQLEAFGMGDRLHDVLDEIPIVRKEAGYVPLVTPTSQIVGVQAVNNVKFGRWQNNITDYVRLVRGEFGQTPVPIDPAFREKITGSPIETRYDPSGFDYTLPTFGDFTKEELYPDKESELLYHLFPKVAGGEKGFLVRRAMENRAKKQAKEQEEYLESLRDRARFKLSSKNHRIASLSEDESESLYSTLVAQVTGETYLAE